MAQMIKIESTWQDTLTLLLALHEDANSDGRIFADQQLRKMAWLADNAFKPLEIGIYPMKYDPDDRESALADNIQEVDHFDVIVRPEGSDPIAEYENLTEEEADRRVGELIVKFPQAAIDDLRELLS